MSPHPVELEPQATLELSPKVRSVLRRLDLPEQLVGVLHVGLVQVPMLFDLLVGHLRQPARLEVLLYVVFHRPWSCRGSTDAPLFRRRSKSWVNDIRFRIESN